jgi:SOS-response transcriptional repressor LexA
MSSFDPFPFPWKQAAERMSANQVRTKGNCEHIPHFYTDQAHWHALRIQGDSMVPPNGLKSFHEGDLIIVDTDKEVKHRDFVIAVLPNAKEAIFKQYVVDSGTKYLKPLNSQYPLLMMDTKTVILGVVVSCIS